MRLSKKISIGFGILVMASGVAVSVNWLSIRGIKEMSTLNDEISKSNECLLQSRRQEKNFILRGFKKFGNDTNNAIDKWQLQRDELKGRLEALRADPGIGRQEQASVPVALSSLADYSAGFERIVDGRKEQDEALASWMNIQSELHAKVKTAVQEAIDPMAAAARQEHDTGALLDLALMERTLNEKVIQPFLLLPVGANDSADQNIGKEAELHPQFVDIRNALQAWKQRTQGYNGFSGIADIIATHMDRWAAAEHAFNDAVKQQDQANTQMVAAARKLGKILNDSNAAINERMFRLMNRSIVLGLVAAAGSLALGVLIAVFTTRRITASIRQASSMLADIANGDGDLTRRLEITTKDEIGEMARWFNLFIERLQEMIRDIAEESRIVESSITELDAVSSQMTQGSQNVSQNSNSVAAAAEQMSNNINSVAVAMEQATTNINMVSGAVEKMSATIEEIARNGSRTTAVTNQAVQEAGQAVTKVQHLGEAAEKIGKVTETITDISEQTNLLSLNATIEAARAGEAGKGFAVVASEIKELAKQTTAATEEIRSKIEGIQLSTVETGEEIGKITKVIHEANELINSIAVAVDGQSKVVRDIADSVVQASAGLSEMNENLAYTNTTAGEMAHNLTDLSQTASDMAQSSQHINKSVNHLSDLAGKLDHMVGQFNI